MYFILLFTIWQSDDSSKEVFRVSYKVFDFSRQFGKLSPQGTAQVQSSLSCLIYLQTRCRGLMDIFIEAFRFALVRPLVRLSDCVKEWTLVGYREQ